MNRIKELREQMGKQQKDLAIDLNVSQPTVSDWESGRKVPSAKSTKKLADYFGVSMDYLLGHGNMPQQKSASEEAQELTKREQKVTFIARKAEQLTEAEYEEIVNHFNDTIDLYLRAKGLDKEDDET